MSDGSSDREKQRREMVERQIADRGVRDDQLLQAMATVPREAFVGDEAQEFAYEDSPLPIGADQTISQPYVVALMLEALDLSPEDRVLEVGAGSGYAAAVASRLAAQVFAVERQPILARFADRSLDRLGFENVTVRHADGTLGWEEKAPFDAILVSASGTMPPALEEQLAPGGRLVMPVDGEGRTQELTRFEKQVDGTMREQSLGAVRFVPLIGTVAGAESSDDTAPDPFR